MFNRKAEQNWVCLFKNVSFKWMNINTKTIIYTLISIFEHMHIKHEKYMELQEYIPSTHMHTK